MAIRIMDSIKLTLHKLKRMASGIYFRCRSFKKVGLALKRKITLLLLCIMTSISITSCGNKGIATKIHNGSNAYDSSFEIIDTDKSVKNYYEKGGWDRAAAFDELFETITTVTDGYTLKSSKDDDGNISVTVASTDSNGDTMACESRIVNDKAYLRISSNLMEKDAIFVTDYDADSTSICTSDYCEVFNLVKEMGTFDLENKYANVRFNGRTTLDGRLVDNITLSFYRDKSYVYALFVDAETHKVIKLSNTIISDDDSTDLIYSSGGLHISDFTEDELNNSVNSKAVELTDENMTAMFESVVYIICNKDDNPADSIKKGDD